MSRLDWNLIRAFHETAAQGSLSAASRRLGLTQPTLSRQVAALEAQLGVSLFDRMGRKLVLTSAGADLLAHTAAMAESAESVALTASGRVQDVGGRVCISATDSFATYILPEIVAQIRQAAPQITTAVVSSNEISNLHRREADIAIRHARPDRAGLVGQHVRDTEAFFYASDDWVARHGLPSSLVELKKDSVIGFADLTAFSENLRGLGIPVEPDDFRLQADSAVVVWEMVRRGLGVSPMLRDVADRTPGVRRLCPTMAPIPVPIWIVTHEELQATPRIRAVQKILADGLAEA